MRLAVPVVIARSGLMAMASVDLLMVGHYAADDLAWASLGGMAAGPLIGVLVGLLIGTMVSTALAFGARDEAAAGAVWRRSVPYALVLGAAMTVACLFGTPFFRAIGQADGLAEGAGRVLAILGLGLPGIALYITSAFWLEAIGRPGPGMVLMIAGNVLNVALNWVLVYGHLGLPAMGAEGSAWATTAMRWVMGLSLAAAIWWLPEARRLGVRSRLAGPGGAALAQPAPPGLRRGRVDRLRERELYDPGDDGGLDRHRRGRRLHDRAQHPRGGVHDRARRLDGHRSPGRPRLGRQGPRRRGGGGLDRPGAQQPVDGRLWPGHGAGARGAGRHLHRRRGGPHPRGGPGPDRRVRHPVLDGGQTVLAHAVRGTGDTWVPSALQAGVYVGVMPVLAWALAFPLDPRRHRADGGDHPRLGPGTGRSGSPLSAWLTRRRGA